MPDWSSISVKPETRQKLAEMKARGNYSTYDKLVKDMIKVFSQSNKFSLFRGDFP